MRQISIFETERSDMHTSIRRTIEMMNEYGPMYDHWVFAWSGGKDSTCFLTLLIYLMDSGKIAKPKKITVLYADTRMELTPLWYVAEGVRDELAERGIPVQVVMAPLDRRFLVYILGRGVPPPNNTTFRWCTRQIKVEPMEAALDAIRAPGEQVLVLTGVRLGESAARDQRIALSCSTKGGAECGSAHFQGLAGSTGDEGPKFYQPPGKNGIATLAPIIHFRICHVWRWLCEWAPQVEFGGWETAELAEAYGGRDGDEAQEIAARTGCVGCPLASVDSALDAILRIPRWAYLAPLKGLRPVYRWLREPGNRLRKGEPERLQGGRLSKSGQRIGPITMEARLEALRRLIAIQDEINVDAKRLNRPLVDFLNLEEVARIRHLIAIGTWPEKWSGHEPKGDTLLPGVTVIEDEDGTQHIETQELLNFQTSSPTANK